MGLLGSFNDAEGKVSSSAGKYRVMQVVLEKNLWEKDRKTFRRSKISAISNTPKGIVCIPLLSQQQVPRDLVAAIVQSATWYLRKWSRSKT